MKVVAVIPVRGGSKGIHKKNLIQVLGKPLMDWSIEAGIKATCITDVVVSSDDDELLENARKFKDVIALKRPSELAQDNSPTEPVLVHVIETLKEQQKKYDYLVLLQATSPLRNANDVDSAFSELKNTKATSLISVCEPEHHPLKSFKINEDGMLIGLVNNEYPFMPRQVLPKVYQPNGAIYMVEITSFLENGKLFTNTTIPYVMSAEKSVDIDTKEDIERLENQLKN